MGNKLPIADIMMIELMQNGIVENQSDQMRTYLLCLAMENLGYELLPEEYSKECFLEKFIEEIQKSSGYLSFISFCKIDEDGLRDLAVKVLKLLE